MIPSKSRKRSYRQRVRCEECEKEFDSDYKERHFRLVHNGRKVKCHPVPGSSDSTQAKISGFFVQGAETESEAAEKHADLVTTVDESEQTGSHSAQAVEADGDGLVVSESNQIALEEDMSEKEPMVDAIALRVGLEIEKLNPSMVEETLEIDELNPSQFIQIENTECENASIPSSQTNKEMSTATTSMSIGQVQGPEQPILTEYPATKFGNEAFARRFQPEWYKKYPWISYKVDKNACVCFACAAFGKDTSFVFTNWKKTSKLTKHSQSENHVKSMTQWAQFTVMQRRKTSVLQQLSSAHQEQVATNRQYLQIIIECLMFTAQQNIAMRGHEERRKDIWEVSDINRGNFIELLHLRCKDLPWLKSKLQSQLQSHAQWTSPAIQNEILDIVSNMVLAKITADVQRSGFYGIIADETSDISRIEQVSMCLRYVIDGETKETFAGFYKTDSTEGEVLYELVKTAVSKLELSLGNIIAECFDGAANMSGAHKGLATRMKQCSPLGIYVHCYGHRLNLALQDTMTEIQPLRNALGIIQRLYNFLEGSTKRHAFFKEVESEEEGITLTMKSQSVTRWSCRWVAVKAVVEQIPKIIKALLALSRDRDPKTYNDSNSLLYAVCDFQFVFGLVVLKVILSNTDALSRYLQGKKMDVVTARKTADAVIKTLSGCRDQESFDLMWSRADIVAQQIKNEIEGTEFTFKDAKVPRTKPSRRLQALVGEAPEVNDGTQRQTAEDHYRTTCYYTSIDKVVAEMRARFEGNDQDVLCALADGVFSSSPTNANIDFVSNFYGLDSELLRSEKQIFENYDTDDPCDRNNASTIVKTMYQNGIHEVLPVVYRVFTILATIPATSCSAERSFSCLRRLKTYLRNTMDQDRLSSIAIINIERAYANKTLENDMQSIINTFGKRHSRNSYFF